MNIPVKGPPERQFIRWLLFTVALVGIAPGMAAADYISTTDNYAWTETAGWTNFRPLYGGVTVNSNFLSGYVWQQNLGWLKLGADGSGPYQNTTVANWGVNRGSAGNLSGYAWSEGWGWVKFNPSGGGVSIDPTSGAFSGYAWAENFGWVSFRSQPGAPITYGVGMPAYILNLVFIGTGGGSVTSATPPFSCNTDCSRSFLNITPLILTAEASPYSIRGGWDGCDTVTGANCTLTLDRDRTARITFTVDTPHTARIDGANPTYFPTLLAAYDHAQSGNTILVWGVDLAESLVCGNSTQVTITGGYDQQYINHNGVTVVRGLSIGKGAVTMDGIVIR